MVALRFSTADDPVFEKREELSDGEIHGAGRIGGLDHGTSEWRPYGDIALDSNLRLGNEIHTVV